MATNCNGARRLSDLLQEQQEPFLEVLHCRSAVEACAHRLRKRNLCAVRKRRSANVTNGTGGVSLLCAGYETARKALRWDLAGCFSCGARQRFRRLPRPGDVGDRCDVASGLDGGDDALDRGRQLSPVSVLRLESPELSNWDEDDEKSSSSASSPPSDHDLPGAATPCSTFFITNGKICAVEVEVEDKNKGLQRKSGEYSLVKEHQAIVSGWERIAADISRIPRLVALDLSGSAREWRRVVGEEEARRVGQSIEAMIFEEVRWEAVRDMICLREF